MNETVKKFKQKRLIEKHQQSNGVGTGKLNLQFTPEQAARFEEQLRNTVPGMNYNSNGSVQQAKQESEQQQRINQQVKEGNKRIADKHAHRAVQERNQRKITPNIDVTKGYSNGTVQDGNKVALDEAFSWYGLSNGLGQMSNISDYLRNTPEFGKFIGDQNINTLVMGLDPINPSLYYNIAARFGKGVVRNWGLTRSLANQINNEVKVSSQLGKQLVSPQQTKPLLKYGDVEINNPQLAYRQVSSGGGKNFIQTGYAYSPQETENLLNYWMGKFKPTLQQRVGLEPGFTEMRPMYSQGQLWYPAGEGDLIVTNKQLRLGNSKGGVTNNMSKAGTRRISEYKGEVTPENSQVFSWEPGYGYKKITKQPSTAYFGDPTQNFLR